MDTYAIPDFTAEGLLPPGIHTCTSDDITDRLTYTAMRQSLFVRFQSLMSQLPDRSCVAYTIINGSFVEQTPSPSDLDALLVVSELRDGTQEQVLASWVDNRQEGIKSTYGCDLFVADEDTFKRAWRSFWGTTRDGTEKGMLKLEEVSP